MQRAMPACTPDAIPANTAPPVHKLDLAVLICALARPTIVRFICSNAAFPRRPNAMLARRACLAKPSRVTASAAWEFRGASTAILDARQCLQRDLPHGITDACRLDFGLYLIARLRRVPINRHISLRIFDF